VNEPTERSTWEPGAYGLEPDRGLFVATKVNAVAQRDGLQVNPFCFAVIDSSGQKYDANITGDGFGPSLNATELAMRQRTTGTVVFTLNNPASGTRRWIAAHCAHDHVQRPSRQTEVRL